MRRSLHLLFTFSLVFLLTRTALAQRGSIQVASFRSYDLLLQDDRVQKELKLSDEQRTKVRELVRAIRMKHQKELERIQSLPAEEKVAAGREEFAKISRETVKQLDTILKADQVRRVRQIMTQLQGLDAFSDPDVQQELKLTDQQKQKITEIEDGLREEGRQIFQGKSRGGLAEGMNKLLALRKQAVGKAVAVLTTEQQKVWKTLTGEPYEAKNQGGFLRPPNDQDKR